MAPTAAAADELVKTYGTGNAVVKALDGVSVTVEAFGSRLHRPDRCRHPHRQEADAAAT